MRQDIPLETLTEAAFAPFGAVIERPRHGGFAANAQTAVRFDDIAPLVLTAPGGRPQLSWMRVRPVSLPFTCRVMERHPRSSQMFVPMGGGGFFVVVAPPGPAPVGLRAFAVEPGAGVNFAPGVWHHPALALAECDLLVLGHAPGAPDCDVVTLTEPVRVTG